MIPYPRWRRIATWLPLLLLVVPAAHPAGAAAPPARPNIVFILADDAGYGDLGCYGQKRIQTPCLDKMAAEGMRFTQAYCGTSVCAPSRCALMTGLHIGHAPIRANREIQPEGQFPLPAGTVTVAKILQEAGYATGCFGKWGLGMGGTTGDPRKNGFDDFYGYLCQRKAHTYYPEYLWRNGEKVELGGKRYSHDLIVDEALAWVKRNKDRPFFLYLPVTIPHAKYEVPDLGPYADKPWTEGQKKYASMMTRLDRDIGRLLALLKDLGLDERTVVFFASDNGSDAPQRAFFDSNGGLRGVKRTMYEGGLREPMLVRWPGQVPAGKTSDAVWAFYDFLPTCAELAGAALPAGHKVDGMSVVPALRGGALPARPYLYWELMEPHFQQAARFGDWKAVRPASGKPVELYDLKNDPAETTDLAAKNPDVLAQAEEILRSARVDSPDWPIREGAAKKPAKRKAP